MRINVDISRIAHRFMKVNVSVHLKIFNNIQTLNWAWVFELQDGSLEQFDCLQCMILESKWHQWKQDPSIVCILPIGTIYFDKMVAEITKDGITLVFKIMRTQNKNRQRPDAELRHQELEEGHLNENQLGLLNPKDLEWLGWNWRGWNNE